MDQNFSEAKDLLKLILVNDVPGQACAEVCIGKRSTDSKEFLEVGGQALAYISSSLNDFRKDHHRWVIIHTCLTDLLVSHKHEDVLKMLGSWKKSISEHETLEFFILPRGTFPEAEKVLSSIVDGVLEIYAEPEGNIFSFVPIRCCSIDNHLKKFPYIISQGKLKIKWGQEFTDTLSALSEKELAERARYLDENKSYLKIVRGPVHLGEELSVRERLLLSQMLKYSVERILTLFSDRKSVILDKLVHWQLSGYIDFSRVEPERSPVVKKNLSVRTKIALMLPSGLAGRIISKLWLTSNTVPADAYFIRRKVDEAFYASLFPNSAAASTVDLESVEDFLQDFTTRIVAYQVVERTGEDPRNALDMHYLPKLMKMMLKMGYAIDSTVREVKENRYEVIVKRCPVCRYSKSERPYCVSLTGAIRGFISMIFKKQFVCVETACVAMGDKKCTFYVELAKEGATSINGVDQPVRLETSRSPLNVKTSE
ncbi:MAG: hypothetical protein HYU39_08800 [Thaumarchaeota archaeon]|nr:hypothetical protein [Nitrososphaerota archaeon]